ncbi:hypothetical protein EMCRGX_G001148 [Ephydatia muelleri]
MSSTGKLSGAQRRKRKAKAAEEARKSSKLLAAFLKVDKEAEHDDLGSKSANEESEANRMESEVTSDNINDSDETSDESEVVAGQEDPKPGPSQLIYHNNPIITFGDIGFMSFTAAARPCIDDATKELLVKTGPDAFRNEDATLPRTLSGTKAVARGMTKNWWQAVRDPSTHPRAEHFSSLAWCFLLSVVSRTAPNVAPASAIKWNDLVVRLRRCPGQRASQGSNSATEYRQVVTANGRERAQRQLQLGQNHAHGEGSALKCP